MDHMRHANYRLVEGTTFDDVVETVRRGKMVDIFRQEPGFKRYELADAGDGTFLSLSLWESHEAADRGTAMARQFVIDNLEGRIDLLANVIYDVEFIGS